MLEESMGDVKKESIEIKLRLGQKTLAEQKLLKSRDVLTKVPLSTQISEDKIVIIATAPGLEENIGSVSIPQYIILNGGLNTYEQWITLFEHEEDDEYDGEMGLNDDEEPRIQVKFEIAQDVVQKKKVYTSTKTVTEKEQEESQQKERFGWKSQEKSSSVSGTATKKSALTSSVLKNSPGDRLSSAASSKQSARPAKTGTMSGQYSGSASAVASEPPKVSSKGRFAPSTVK